MKKLIDLLVLAGALGLAASVILKFIPIPLPSGLVASTALKFTVASLILAIALSVRGK